MMKLSRLAAHAVILVISLASAAYARDLDRSDPDRAHILAAIHRLNDNDPNLKQYRYFVVDLVKDRNAAFVCAALADKNGGVEMTDGQAEIMTFALENRSPQWVATRLTGVGFAAGAQPLQSDCRVNGRVVNTFADINAALKSMGHKPFASR